MTLLDSSITIVFSQCSITFTCIFTFLLFFLYISKLASGITYLLSPLEFLLVRVSWWWILSIFICENVLISLSSMKHGFPMHRMLGWQLTRSMPLNFLLWMLRLRIQLCVTVSHLKKVICPFSLSYRQRFSLCLIMYPFSFRFWVLYLFIYRHSISSGLHHFS